MKKRAIYLSTVLITGLTSFTSMTGCSSYVPVNTSVNTPEKVTNQADDSMGTIVIKLDDTFKTKGFNTKATMMDPYITQVRVDVTGNNMVPVTKTVTWIRNIVLTIPIKVPSGKNRIISVSGLDSSGKPIAKMMSYSHIYKNSTIPALMNYGTTAVARVMNNILNSSNHDMVPELDTAKLKKYVYNVTGYNDAKDTYTGVNPLKVDVNAITQKIIDNNGVPEDVENIEGLGTEALPAKVKVFVKDKNGNNITTGVLISANDISCVPAFNNGSSFDLTVDPGTWEISATVYLNAAGTTVIVPQNSEEVRKLILGQGQVLNAKKSITISGTDAQENTLTLEVPQVIL